MQLSEEQIKELELIGGLYRKTVYDTTLINLPSIVASFASELKNLDNEISNNILGEVLHFHALITSDYSSSMRARIDGLHNLLSEELASDVSFNISCRLKSWESTLRKILKYYFHGRSVILSDLMALRIVLDADKSEEELECLCHEVCTLCRKFFSKNEMCRIVSPAKQVAGNALFKDYILNPKPNGYKSIHLAFMDQKSDIFEVQIRTQLMDANAELGAKEEDIILVDSLKHDGYKDCEYEGIIPHISFDVKKANRPMFRTYERSDELKIVDKIGLMFAKHVEERARTH